MWTRPPAYWNCARYERVSGSVTSAPLICLRKRPVMTTDCLASSAASCCTRKNVAALFPRRRSASRSILVFMAACWSGATQFSSTFFFQSTVVGVTSRTSQAT